MERSILHSIKGAFHKFKSAFYANRLRQAMANVGIPDSVPSDFNEILHYLRGRELDGIPKNIGVFLSVGCAGTWYFDWIEKHCGPIGSHIGIEFFSPKPSDLPSNAIWIANTAGNLKDVSDQTADVLFSGQNIEHLWPNDVVNFLLESHRVLKPGGLLAIDSPNRALTSVAKWSHPEHTLEFTAVEMVELLNLAGFEIETKNGIWRCIDHEGTLLDVALNNKESFGAIKWRVATAKDHPNECFVWWINAIRSAKRVPQPEALHSRVQEIFEANWTERARRMLTIVGKDAGNNSFISVGVPGVLMYGPYMPLPAGSYKVTLNLLAKNLVSAASVMAMCDVISGDGEVLACREICSDEFGQEGHLRVEMHFTLKAMTFGLQFRVIVNDESELVADGNIVILSHNASEFSTTG